MLESAIKVVIPAQAGIQTLMIILDSVSRSACTEWQKSNCDTVSCGRRRGVGNLLHGTKKQWRV